MSDTGSVVFSAICGVALGTLTVTLVCCWVVANVTASPVGGRACTLKVVVCVTGRCQFRTALLPPAPLTVSTVVKLPPVLCDCTAYCVPWGKVSIQLRLATWVSGAKLAVSWAAVAKVVMVCSLLLFDVVPVPPPPHALMTRAVSTQVTIQVKRRI